MAAKKSTSKKATSKKTTGKKSGTGGTFMHETREQDAKDAKNGQAAEHVKQSQLYADEMNTRLKIARRATSTPEAIAHDLDRAIVLCDDVKTEATKARKKLAL